MGKRKKNIEIVKELQHEDEKNKKSIKSLHQSFQNLSSEVNCSLNTTVGSVSELNRKLNAMNTNLENKIAQETKQREAAMNNLLSYMAQTQETLTSQYTNLSKSTTEGFTSMRSFFQDLYEKIDKIDNRKAPSISSAESLDQESMSKELMEYSKPELPSMMTFQKLQQQPHTQEVMTNSQLIAPQITPNQTGESEYPSSLLR